MKYEVHFPVGKLTVDMLPNAVDLSFDTPTGTITHRITGQQAKEFADRLGTSARRTFLVAYRMMRARLEKKP